MEHQIGARIDQLLNILWNARGTDLLLTVGMQPQIRVHGSLTPLDGPKMNAVDTESLLAELLNEDQAAAWKNHREYDFSFSWRDQARIRGNAFTQRGYTTVALRMIPREIPTMES